MSTRWWEDKRFDVMDTDSWRARYCLAGFTLLLMEALPAFLHPPEWRIWVGVGGLGYGLWVTSVFLIMGRRQWIDHKAQQAEWDAHDDDAWRRWGDDDE